MPTSCSAGPQPASPPATRPAARSAPGATSTACCTRPDGLDEAGAEAEQATRIAEASRDPELIARARILQARQLWGTGKDLEEAYLLLRQAAAGLFPKGNYYVQRDCLGGLANLSLELGHYREGLDASRRMADLAAANHDPYAEANARYGMARRAVLPAQRAPQRRRAPRSRQRGPPGSGRGGGS